MKNFENKVHIAMPMRNKGETRQFYEEILGMRVLDFSPSELYVDFFDQHIAFHQMAKFSSVASPQIVLASPEENGSDTFVPSMHVGAFISQADFKTLSTRLLESDAVKISYGPVHYTKNGLTEYMLHFYDCNGNALELKANSTDHYSFDDIALWSHTNTHRYTD